MSDIAAGFLDSAKGVISKFHYGHRPSIVMWSNGPAPQKDDATGFFGGAARKLESLLTSEVPESFNSFKFDAMVKEGHQSDSVVTSFPVSSGFVVSDHLIKKNRILQLHAVASNMQNSSMSTFSVQGLSVLTGAVFNNPLIGQLGRLAGTVASAFETSDRIRSTYDLFRSFQVNGTKLYVNTIAGTYLNCVVTSIRTEHTKDSSFILALEITLEELQTVTQDELATQARKAMESMYDYSEFAKMAQSMAMGVVGGAPLPGLGPLGSLPTKQLSNLKDKLGKLASPLSSIKGRFL